MMGVSPFVLQSNVLHRAFAQEPRSVVSGSGLTLTTEDGRKIIDASAGPSVSVLGHHQPEIAEAVSRQINEIAYVYSGAPFTTDPTEELATMLLQHRPGGLSKAIFVNSGSEATDAALKLATQYWHELGALSVSGHDSRRALYKDWLSHNVSFVDPCYSYRGKADGETDEQYVRRLRDQFESEILRLGPENVAGFIAETVSGTTLGCVTPVPGYFQAIREICDKYDILLILDEIMCGMGKTGTMHAWEQEGIRGPDIQTIGKALGAGFVPLSGVLMHQKIFDALAQGSGGLMHGHTFQAHPTACAAAVQAQKIIRREDLLKNVSSMGKYLEQLLHEFIAPLRFVADVRGRGLFWAVEFMLDKERRIPFPVESNMSNNVVSQTLNNGVSILGNLGTTGKIHVEHVIVSPAYTVTQQELYDIVQALKLSIEQVSDFYREKPVWESLSRANEARL